MQLEMIMIVPSAIFLSQCIFYTTFGVFNRFIRIHIFPIGQTDVLPLSLCLIAGQFLALLIAWQIASQPVSQTQREREREIAMQGAKEMERNGDRGQLSVSSVVETSVAVAVWRRGIPWLPLLRCQPLTGDAQVISALIAWPVTALDIGNEM